jgi:diguanylate cyclase (GGDEF)-like protein
MAVPLAQGDLRITVSVGVADRQGEEIGLDHLLGRADHALYRAKLGGRDRVEVAPAKG